MDECSYASTNSEAEAFYYASVLNYLAYKIIAGKKVFTRNQYLRPLLAIMEAKLEWRGEKWQKEVAENGKKLQERTKDIYEGKIKKGIMVKETFKILEKEELFNKLLEILDKHVRKENLDKALKQVSS